MVTNIIDIGIIVLFVLMLYYFFRRTEALKILAGLLFIYVIYLISSFMGLERTTYILKNIFEWSSIGIIVIFHQELRMMLKKIGGITGVALEKKETIAAIEESVYRMSEEKVGALIMFDPQRKITFQTDDMVKIDSICSSDLLETIFHKNTKLHDGAVIIQNGRIAFAGCKLPLSGKKRPELGHLGTRHIAAVENAEMFGVIAVIVSEETGSISIATEKGLTIVPNRRQFKEFFLETKDKRGMFGKKNRK